MTRTNPDVVYLPSSAIRRAVGRFKTPFFIYEEERLRENCRRFREAFRRHFPTFAPLYAVKANTNPEIVKIVFSEGFGADASSEAEAWLTRKLGSWGMYSGLFRYRVLGVVTTKRGLGPASDVPSKNCFRGQSAPISTTPA